MQRYDKEVLCIGQSIKALFEAPNILCPKDYATFKNNSTGQIDSWTWDFADGTISNDQIPSDHLFPDHRSRNKLSRQTHRGQCKGLL